ncbi:unnamed protein product [Echinostoma caproni]|uniref:V-type proton ATPase subunit a n=1 Tax=Echinostoma caproni TaxID=27848 RepID=A0A183AL26_9TREM|nr:unnamed protein product [Echinostoma caproni]
MEKSRKKIRLFEQEIEVLQRPHCRIVLKGQKKSELQNDYRSLQARLEDAWNRLHMPQSQRVSLLANICLMADDRCEMLIVSRSTWKYVELWEQAAQDVAQRESLIVQEANLEIGIMDPNLSDKSEAIAQRVTVAEQRGILQKGEPYLEKMAHDRSNLQYHLHMFRTEIHTKIQNVTGSELDIFSI